MSGPQHGTTKYAKLWKNVRLAIFVSDLFPALGPNSHPRICGCTRKQRQSTLPRCSQLTGTDLRISGVKRTLQKAECNKRNERIEHVHSSNESMVTGSIAMETLYLSFTMQGNLKRNTRIHLRITPGTTSHHNAHMLLRTWERHEPSGTSYHFSIKSG